MITVILCCGFISGVANAAADMNAFGQLMDKAKTYDYGKSRTDLVAISDMIRQASGTPEIKEIEKQLDNFLKSDVSYAAKQFVCRELSVVGTEASVAVLAPMLTDANMSDMARYALERIPGDGVDAALREALPKAAGNTKIGIVNTLGVRGDKKAVGLLAGMIKDSNEMTAGAAIAALGRIDDPAAKEAIAKAKDEVKGALRAVALDAYIRCADRLAAKGEKDAASAIYKQLYAAGEPEPIRAAALRGIIMTAGDKTGEQIVEVLKSNDKAMQTIAIALLKEAAKTDVIKAAAEQMPNLGAVQQVQLLAALADCKDKVGLPAVLAAAKSTDGGVRIAALNALGALGDATTVDVLVQTAVNAKGAEQKASQESLYRLKGADIDQVILKGMPEAEPKAKVELIRSCDQRNITAATPALMKLVKDADGQVRVEAIKALRAVAGPGDIAGLIELQLAATGTDRGEMEKTVVAVARKIPADKNPAEKVLAALSAAKDMDAKSSLMSVAGKIGDPAALPVLREALADKDDKIKDAGVRALSEWPTAAPAADLLKVAKESTNEVHKTLALRGYVRLTGLESDRPAEETIKMYKEAMSLAANAADKKMVLSGLGNTKGLGALQMAGGYLEDTELKQEAEAAVVKIAETTMRSNPQETKELLQKVVDGTTSDFVKEQAQRLLRPRQ
jgi:HEAT repeat protein